METYTRQTMDGLRSTKRGDVSPRVNVSPRRKYIGKLEDERSSHSKFNLWFTFDKATLVVLVLDVVVLLAQLDYTQLVVSTD